MGDYFHSQTKVAAMINRGVSFSRTELSGDKLLGSKLYFLYMFICLLNINN